MEEDSLRNWGYYEAPLKGHLGLQLMSCMGDGDNPAMVSANGSFHPPHTHDCVVAKESHSNVMDMDYVRDSWINHREKLLNMFSAGAENSYNSVVPETTSTQHSTIIMHHHHVDATKETDSNMEEFSVNKKEGVPAKKRTVHSKAKLKPRKGPAPKEKNVHPSSVQGRRIAKKNIDVVINCTDMDISSIPIPVCSCTGTLRQCYRWGCGGWQSACCTTTISMYPMPMSTKRHGARIAGRKMSQGAFKKVLEKLANDAITLITQLTSRLTG